MQKLCPSKYDISLKIDREIAACATLALTENNTYFHTIGEKIT